MPITANTEGEALGQAVHSNRAVTASAVEVAPVDGNRRELAVQNVGASSVWLWFGVGTGVLTVSTGLELAAGQTFLTPFTGPVWAISAGSVGIRVVEFG